MLSVPGADRAWYEDKRMTSTGRWMAAAVAIETAAMGATGMASAQEFAAIYGEYTYELEPGKPFTLATQMQILGK